MLGNFGYCRLQLRACILFDQESLKRVRTYKDYPQYGIRHDLSKTQHRIETTRPQISLTNPTSTKLSNGIFISAIFVLEFSRIHKNAIKNTLLAIFVPFLIVICSLPITYTVCVSAALLTTSSSAWTSGVCSTLEALDTEEDVSRVMKRMRCSTIIRPRSGETIESV